MTPQVAALLDTRSMWYVTRATGVVSLVLLTASVVLGVTETVRWASDRWPRFVTAGIHKNVSLTATAFIAVHIVTAIVDGFAPIGWLDTVVPFHSAYRPIWLGLGTVAFDLLVAIAVTSLLRQRIGHRAWRIVHWAAYACWPVALLHGLGTGTDAKTTSLFALELVCMAAVVVAVWWRIAAGWPQHERQRIFAAARERHCPGRDRAVRPRRPAATGLGAPRRDAGIAARRLGPGRRGHGGGDHRERHPAVTTSAWIVDGWSDDTVRRDVGRDGQRPRSGPARERDDHDRHDTQRGR